MAEDDDEVVQREPLAIDPEMIWGTRLDENTVRIYLNEFHTMTISNEAAEHLHKALDQALRAKPAGCI